MNSQRTYASSSAAGSAKVIGVTPDGVPVITSPDIDRWRGGFATTGKVEEISRMLAGGAAVKQDVRVNIEMNVGTVGSRVDVQRMLRDLGRSVATEMRKAGPLVA